MVPRVGHAHLAVNMGVRRVSVTGASDPVRLRLAMERAVSSPIHAVTNQ